MGEQASPHDCRSGPGREHAVPRSLDWGRRDDSALTSMLRFSRVVWGRTHLEIR
jgi:hypothetical protein